MFMVSAEVLPISKNTACKGKGYTWVGGRCTRPHVCNNATSCMMPWRGQHWFKICMFPHQVEDKRSDGIGQEDRRVKDQSRVPHERSQLNQYCIKSSQNGVSNCPLLQRQSLDCEWASLHQCGVWDRRGKVVGQECRRTEWQSKAQQTGRRHVVEALQRIHVKALAVDEDLDESQSRRLQLQIAYSSSH